MIRNVSITDIIVEGGTVTTILLLSRQNCGEIMTQTRNTSATTRGRYQAILQGIAKQCFFLEIFPTKNDKT